MPLRRLDPEPGDVSPLEAAQSLRPAERAPADRPYVLANMVSSADGRATLDGRSAGLSNEADRELFHALREQVDAVLVGTGTLRTERYGPFVRDPERRARRETAGLAPDPLGCVGTRSLRPAGKIPPFAEPRSDAPACTSGHD